MGLGGQPWASATRSSHEPHWRHDVAGRQWVAAGVGRKEKWVWWVEWREKREIGKEGKREGRKGVPLAEEGGDGVADGDVAGNGSTVMGVRGRRKKKCIFNMSKAKFKKLSPTTCHPASPLSRRVERSKKCEKTENLKVSKDRSPEECPSSKSIPNFNIILTSFITFSLKYFYEISLFYKVIFGF